MDIVCDCIFILLLPYYFLISNFPCLINHDDNSMISAAWLCLNFDQNVRNVA